MQPAAAAPFAIGDAVTDKRKAFQHHGRLTVRGIWERDDYDGGFKVQVEVRACEHCGGAPLDKHFTYTVAAGHLRRA